MTGRERWSQLVVAPLVTGTVSGVVASIVAGVALLVYTPDIAGAFVRPSCSDPGPLVLVPARLDPATAADGTNTADRLVDGRTDTYWVPPRGQEVGSKLHFTFDHDVDLRLICVVNGQPTSQAAYDGAGKLREVSVATDATAGRGELVSRLLAQPAGQIQNAQNVGVDHGGTGSATIVVRSVYSGLDVHDPSENRFRPGGLTAVAEVEFYAAEDRR